MDRLCHAPVTTLARLIRERDVTCVEVVRACLDRIATVNPVLNAVVQLRAEGAMADARAADAALSHGDAVGPLHGVPMTIKDSFETAGVVTTAGTMGLAEHVPAHDATVVARLRAAGAILLGKTNVPELTLHFKTDNHVYGRTTNPYDPERIAGGSSGGAAAIVAAGGAPFDVGSDMGGSIRVPAHCCGVAGLKPTAGRVSRAGHIPFLELGAAEGLTQVGPIARSVADLSLVLPIIAGPDGRDPTVVPAPLGDPASVSVDTLRIAFYTNDGINAATDETAGVVRDAATALADRGADVVEDRPPGLEGSLTLWSAVAMPDGGAAVRRLLRALGTERMHPFLRWSQRGEDAPASAYVRTLATWNAYRAQSLGFLDRYDALVTPAAPMPAPRHDERTPFSYGHPYNLLGWPAVVVRCGTSAEGMPIGVQVVAGPWHEHVALAVAGYLEETFGGWRAPEV